TDRMVVSVIGGHGQIALALTRLLAREDAVVRSLIRDSAQADDIRAAGGEPYTVDFERAADADIDAAIDGSDAVVFAAGAGPGSSAERKETVDYGAAVRLIGAAQRCGGPRYVMISAFRADPDFPGDEVFAVYQRAKGRADAELEASGLDHLILRPVRLTDEAATGRISLVRSPDQPESEFIPRDEVAAVLAEAILRHPEVSGIWNLSSGRQPVADALN
ncbi:MAG: NAD(P)H-binding protein, partial [Vibrio fluvialis]